MTQVLPKKTIFSPDTSREVLFALPSTLHHLQGQRAAVLSQPPCHSALCPRSAGRRGLTNKQGPLALCSSLPVSPVFAHLSSALKGMVSTLLPFQNACLIMHNSHFSSGLEIPSLTALMFLPYKRTMICTVK